MITLERLAAYKEQAIAAVAARAENRNLAGVSCVGVTPHDLLDLILSFEETTCQEDRQ